MWQIIFMIILVLFTTPIVASRFRMGYNNEEMYFILSLWVNGSNILAFFANLIYQLSNK